MANSAEIHCIDSGVSVAAMRRVSRLKAAYSSAFSTDNRMAGWKAWLPGRMTSRTPANPTAMATQRRASSRSRSSHDDSIAISSGTENWIAPVSASCRYCSAKKLSAVMAASMLPRSACIVQLPTRTSAGPWRGASNRPISSTCRAKRSHTTSTTGRC